MSSSNKMKSLSFDLFSIDMCRVSIFITLHPVRVKFYDPDPAPFVSWPYPTLPYALHTLTLPGRWFRAPFPAPYKAWNGYKTAEFVLKTAINGCRFSPVFAVIRKPRFVDVVSPERKRRRFRSFTVNNDEPYRCRFLAVSCLKCSVFLTFYTWQ